MTTGGNMNFDVDFDMSALQDELQRVTVDKKPGAVKKFGNFLDKTVKMPQKDGFVTIRLLPSLPGKKLPYASCRIHNLATFEEREQKPPKTRNEYCGRSLQGKQWVGDCFYCDYYSHLYRQSDKYKNTDEDLAKQFVAKAKAIKPLEKYYYNAIVLDSNPPTGQTPEDGPLIYSCGITLHAKILEAVLGNKEMKKKSKGNVFHPQTGRNLKIEKVMKPGGMFPDYSGTEWEDVSALTEDSALLEKWIANMNDVFSLCKVHPIDHMKKMLRIFEGKEIDTKKSFDASFLGDDDEVNTRVSISIPDSILDVTSSRVTTTVAPQQSVNIDPVDDDPLVDPAFAANIANALGNIS